MSNATSMTMPSASIRTAKKGSMLGMFALVGLALLAVFLFMSGAHASSAGESSALPWDTNLKVLVDSISGPVAKLISIAGVVVTGIMLVFGGEISEFARRMILLVLVISVIMFATSIIGGTMFSGATIPDATSFIGGTVSNLATSFSPAA